MKRREFIKFGATGLTVVGVGSMAGWPLFWPGAAQATSLDGERLELEMVNADAQMVTGALVPMWAYRLNGHDHGMHSLGGPRIPGLALISLPGERIRLRLTNCLDGARPHRFAIPGVTLTVNGTPVQSVLIPRGEENAVDIEFTAPEPGTYMYLDPENAPVNRMMGLHGLLVVLPDPLGNTTPYRNPTPNIQKLFDDLGTAPHFPGNPWDSARNAIWVFNALDSSRCAEAAASPAAIDPARFSLETGFRPDYFFINGKSGFFAAQHSHHSEGIEGTNFFSLGSGLHSMQSHISIRGRVGQPLVIRTVNAGIWWHSPHIHGNHVYALSEASYLSGERTLHSNLAMVDTWSLGPGMIKEMLLPFIQPPDIPADAWPPQQERFPLVYPMHDHNEITNTAAGGNYPQGAVTHWQIDGPFDPADPAGGVIFVDRAELRVKTGQILLEGRFTVRSPSDSDPHYLDVHAGGADGPIFFGRIRVGTDGRFSYRGRAIKTVNPRFVTLMHHGVENPEITHAHRTVNLRLR